MFVYNNVIDAIAHWGPCVPHEKGNAVLYNGWKCPLARQPILTELL